jgi:hypothetical protein
MSQTTDYQARTTAIREARLRLKTAEEAYRASLRSSKDTLAQAKRSRERALKEANAQLRAANSSYDSRVNAAKRALTAAQDGQLLGKLGSVRVFDSRLETPDGTVPLSTDITAKVETSKTGKNSNEVLLLISTPTFDTVVRYAATPVVMAHQFVAKLNTAAKNASEHLRTHKQRLENAEKTLESATADRSEIEAATAKLTEIEADTHGVDQAEADLAAAEADTEELEARRAELLELDPTAKIKDVNAGSLGSIAPLIWWRERSKPARIGLIAGGSFFALLVLLIIIGSISGSPSSSKKATKKPSLAFSMTQPTGGSDTTTKTTYKITGTASKDAQVTVNGKLASRSGRQFSFAVPLRKGENAIKVKAVKSGLPTKVQTLTIVRKLPPVALSVSGTYVTVRQPTYTIKGRTTPGAHVKVGGQAASVSGSHFERTVQLAQGQNVIGVRADKAGLASRYTKVTIVRKLTASEIAQKREAQKQSFMNSCRTIPFNQLNKNADGYAGTRVKYYGEIFQIQESSLGGGMMLLSVTDMGYDIWSDEVWVNYTGRVRGAEGDKLTVYGTVVGTKTYEAQIGERYVPEIDAKYVVE